MELLIVLIIIFVAASSKKKGGKWTGYTAKFFGTLKDEFFAPPPDPPMEETQEDEAPPIFMEGEGAPSDIHMEGAHGGAEGECIADVHEWTVAVTPSHAQAPAEPRMSAAELRRAVVMMEILSPPKALRGRR